MPAKRIPASIRSKNPGAMWPGPVSKKWGATRGEALNDGTGQGNKIAYFPSFVIGICAQIDLWRGPRYRNKKFKDAIAVWSGGNHVQSYINFVLKRVPGMKADTVINDAFLSSEMGMAFLKAQAWHEAGQPYPATDAEFKEAQRKVFGGKLPSTTKKSGGAVATGTATGTAVQQAGFNPLWALAIGLGIAIVVFLVWHIASKAKALPAPAVDNQHGVVPVDEVKEDQPDPEVVP